MVAAGFEPTPTMNVDNFQIIVIKPLSSYRVRYQRTLDSQNLKISINIGDALTIYIPRYCPYRHRIDFRTFMAMFSESLD